MLGYAVLLVCFYVCAKAYVRFWLFKPLHVRPAITRYNEVLRFIDFAALTALLAALFILINAGSVALTVTLLVGMGLYDATLRFCFIEVEARRLRSSSVKWSTRAARRHVRRRAQAPMFN